MALTKETVDQTIEVAKVVAEEKLGSAKVVVESVKDFFKNLLKPNMKIEDIKEVAMPRLAELIEKNEKNGLQYSAGKFHVKYADEKHFQLEFEMYFKDAEDKWHKVANESERRELDLLEEGAAKTLSALKDVTFPIEIE
ncbi:MAG: hypothetical protein IJU55_05160 [Selenomonadaceae bacterium]|nr:hypothetical protein [Selenomonadaceae bacterium]